MTEFEMVGEKLRLSSKASESGRVKRNAVEQ
jgi:hypothetical protein